MLRDLENLLQKGFQAQNETEINQWEAIQRNQTSLKENLNLDREMPQVDFHFNACFDSQKPLENNASRQINYEHHRIRKMSNSYAGAKTAEESL